MRRQLASLLNLVLVCASLVRAQSQTTLQPKEGDFVLHDFHLRSGETLPELRLHYATLGTPVSGASKLGEIVGKDKTRHEKAPVDFTKAGAENFRDQLGGPKNED